MNGVFSAFSGFDSSILRFFQENIRTDYLTPIMKFLSYICNYGTVWLLMGFILFAVKKYRRQGLTVLGCIAAAFVLNNLVIKNLVDRTRPYYVLEWLELLIDEERDASFPSGHTCSSFAAAYAMVKTCGRKYSWAYILAVLIAVSRIYLGVHFPTDVIGGMIVGTSVAVLGCFIRKYLYMPWEKHDEPPSDASGGSV